MTLPETIDRLMGAASSPGECKAAADDLFDCLTGAINLSDAPPLAADGEETLLPTGTAISPRDAARCARDPLRTSRFLRGVEAAIVHQRAKRPGERLRVLYAGCGPLATLVLPLATRFTPDEVELVLLDRHRRSLDAAATLARRFGLADHVRDYVETDAATFRCPGDRRPHVLVCEAMQRALEKEPQVAIVTNLAPQLAPGGSLVPEEVALRAELFRPSAEFALVDPVRDGRERILLGEVFVLDRDSPRGAPEPVTVTLPDPIPDGFAPMVRTSITVFGDLRLDDYDSGLTVPLLLHDLPAVRGGETLEFRYRVESRPGLAYRIVDGPAP